jgi:hypothetical protein
LLDALRLSLKGYTELEHAITRYEEKSHCTTILVSTPNAPGGLFQRIVRQLKVAFGEDPTWKPEHIHPDIMEILPISFATTHKEMLSHLYTMINKGYIGIPEKYDKDKKQTSYSDLLDALRLSLKCYTIR